MSRIWSTSPYRAFAPLPSRLSLSKEKVLSLTYLEVDARMRSHDARYGNAKRQVLRRSSTQGAVAAAVSLDMDASGSSKKIDSRNQTLVCTSLTASTVQDMLDEAQEAIAAGADIVELRIDYLTDFHPESDLPQLLNGCSIPAIVTYRPSWEGGKYEGDESERLSALCFAIECGATYIDVELKAASRFADMRMNRGQLPSQTTRNESSSSTKLIISAHDYEATPSESDMWNLVQSARAAGADVVKFATTATDIRDAISVLRILRRSVSEGIPTIALAMAERGQITRILAPKYGGFLTFGALSPERASAPGQPTLAQLRDLYRLQCQDKDTKVLGIVGNPVSHSRSPAIHNAAMAEANFNGVFVPLLVDDMSRFMSEIEPEADWIGLCVTIPHKEAALKCAASSDEVASQIGAANTLVRQPKEDGTFKAYNTDWSAAISAIERGLGGSGLTEDADMSPLRGKTVVVVGAGGAGRALGFGAVARGAASVIIANRTAERAELLAASLNTSRPQSAKGLAQGVSLSDVASGNVSGNVLVNTTSVGMHPAEGESPVPAEILKHYELVFDAVYTPMETKLLREAKESGCIVVTGEKMFVGQAADQFQLFTGLKAPVQLMTDVVVKSLGQ